MKSFRVYSFVSSRNEGIVISLSLSLFFSFFNSPSQIGPSYRIIHDALTPKGTVIIKHYQGFCEAINATGFGPCRNSLRN